HVPARARRGGDESGRDPRRERQGRHHRTRGPPSGLTLVGAAFRRPKTPMTNRQIRLQRRPRGAPTRDDFSIVDAPMPAVQDGHVLRRTIYLSLDPYMRGRMSDARSYATPVAIGDVMVGGTVSQVIESRDAKFSAGDFVTGMDGWQQYASSQA